MTVFRDPHAKTPEAKRPNAKPAPIEEFPGTTPAASAPPIKTRATESKKRPLSRRPSRNISRPTAKIGIAAAASAAVVASVKACAIKRRSEPKPNPIPPIQNPFAQGSLCKATLLSKMKIKKSIVSKAKKSRKAIRITIPHVCKSWSAAGKPRAKKTTAIAQKILPRIFTENVLLRSPPMHNLKRMPDRNKPVHKNIQKVWAHYDIGVANDLRFVPPPP